MAEDQQGGDSYESTIEVDKNELMAEISGDHGKSSAERSESPTAKMPAVGEDTKIERNPLLAAEEDVADGSTIPMPAVSHEENDDLATTNFAVPDELLEQISRPEADSRWETMEIVIEELEDSEISEISEISEVEFETEENDQSFILEKIADPPGNTYNGELSSKQTSPVLYRMEFEARVNEDGTISIPQKYLDSGHVRPGMRFKIEAIGQRDD